MSDDRIQILIRLPVLLGCVSCVTSVVSLLYRRNKKARSRTLLKSTEKGSKLNEVKTSNQNEHIIPRRAQERETDLTMVVSSLESSSTRKSESMAR